MGDDSPTTMQLLLAHHYAHPPSSASPGATTARAGQSTTRTHQRPLPYAALFSHGFSGGMYSPYLFSSVNVTTHQMPRTLGSHYGVAPYYLGNNEFDVQLRREKASAVTSTKAAQQQQQRRPRTAECRLSGSTAATTITTTEAPSLPRTSPLSPISGDGLHLSCSSFSAYATRSAGHTISTNHTRQAPSHLLAMTSPLPRTYSGLPPLSRSTTTSSTAPVPAPFPEPCMRVCVAVPSRVTRDSASADAQRRFQRYLAAAAAAS